MKHPEKQQKNNLQKLVLGTSSKKEIILECMPLQAPDYSYPSTGSFI